MKFPRIKHFSWSPCLSKGDRRLKNDDILVGKNVVVTLKLDGENCGMTRERCHARSLDSIDHPSQHWVKRLHANIKHDIPEHFKIFGENMYAEHTIPYDELGNFFYVFCMFDKTTCLSWKDTREFSEALGLLTIPEMYVGPWDKDKVVACQTGKTYFGGEQEGYIVRNVEAFELTEWDKNYAKARYVAVRDNEHWKKNWKPNHLREM